MKDERTDAQLDVIIASWYGFTEIKRAQPGRPIEGAEHTGLCPFSGQRRGIPFFSYSLDAIHAAEEKLELQASGKYAEELCHAVRRNSKLPWVDAGSFAHIAATARSRAEALVKVIEIK